MPKQALWSAIQSEIEADIHSGSYPAGSKLPTEAELAARCGVNRHTVRRAPAALTKSQIVHPRRGADVFVQPDVSRYPIGNRVRFHKNLQADGKLPSKSVLSLETRPANAAEAERLMLGADKKVNFYSGLSSANAVPIA